MTDSVADVFPTNFSDARHSSVAAMSPTPPRRGSSTKPAHKPAQKTDKASGSSSSSARSRNGSAKDLSEGVHGAAAALNFDLRQGDAVRFLRGLAPDSVDLLVTDPPYESLEKHRAVGTTTRLKHSKASSNDWFEIFPNQRFPELFREVYRVLKRDRHFYLFCDAETMFEAKPAAEAQGFKFWKPIVWDKRKIGMGYHYRSRYEMILFFEKGKRRLNDLGQADVIEYPRVHGGYPAEKPAEVNEVLVRQSTMPGELVVDPFMGSGSAGVAALRQQRCFLGNDLRPQAVQWTRERLQELGTPQELYEALRDPQGSLI